MQKTALTIFGALLVAGSMVQMASATEHHVRKHRVHAAATEQFLNANNAEHANAACQGREVGNSHDRDTDYQAWSNWEAVGSWDIRGGC
jgi:hypothetical protein